MKRYHPLIDLAGMQNPRLDEICRELGIRGFSKMNRAQKKNAIIEAQRLIQ